MKKLIGFAGIILLLSLSLRAQKTTCAAELSMQKHGLVEVTSQVPGVLVELKYATADNFMKKDVYGCLTHAYLQKETMAKLKKAQALLEKEHPGYHLLIYDAARPLSKQWELWNTLTEYAPESFSRCTFTYSGYDCLYGSSNEVQSLNEIPIDPHIRSGNNSSCVTYLGTQLVSLTTSYHSDLFNIVMITPYV